MESNLIMYDLTYFYFLFLRVLYFNDLRVFLVFFLFFLFGELINDIKLSYKFVFIVEIFCEFNNLLFDLTDCCKYNNPAGTAKLLNNLLTKLTLASPPPC